MEEKKKNNTFLKVLVVVLLLIICFGLGWFGKDYIQVSEKNEKSSSNDKQNNSSEKTKEVELDIHSSLVQLLYNEVSYDLQDESWVFNETIYSHEFAIDKDFLVSSASEKDKMKLIARILKENEYLFSCENVPERADVGYLKDKLVSGAKCSDYYTKEQVENAYHQLYGSGATSSIYVLIFSPSNNPVVSSTPNKSTIK